MPFPDCGPVDDKPWRAVGTLSARDVARGFGDSSYDPSDPVLHEQTIAFISRAMVRQGWWQRQPDNPALYPPVTADSGHREDIAIGVRYAGPVPDTNAIGEDRAAWSTPGTREWFALVLWTARDRHFRLETLPRVIVMGRER